MNIARTGDDERGVEAPERLFLEAQASLDGEECVFHISGTIYSFIPGRRPERLLGYAGYNVRRFLPAPERGGLFLASREIVFYTDLKTGEPLAEWRNPITGAVNEVFHVANDPINFRWRLRDGEYFSVSVDGEREFGRLEAPTEWEGNYLFTFDIFPFYPLPGWDRNYTAAEMFDYCVPKTGLAPGRSPAVLLTWTRVGPWLPWMQMDGHEGNLLYHARAVRLASWDLLPDVVKRPVTQRYPLYRHAPTSVDPRVPNATSWSVHRAEMERRRAAAPR